MTPDEKAAVERAVRTAFYGTPDGAPGMTKTPTRIALMTGLGCAALGAVALVAALLLGNWIVATRGFGLFSCVREPYYPALVKRIANDPAFARELGTPIVIDNPKVFCSKISDDSDTHTGTCELPARGPKGEGNVHAEILEDDGELSATLRLHIGDRIVPAGS